MQKEPPSHADIFAPQFYVHTALNLTFLNVDHIWVLNVVHNFDLPPNSVQVMLIPDLRLSDVFDVNLQTKLKLNIILL